MKERIIVALWTVAILGWEKIVKMRLFIAPVRR